MAALVTLGNGICPAMAGSNAKKPVKYVYWLLMGL
jgi:hypothetical protein